jgi:hypothetical protein
LEYIKKLSTSDLRSAAFDIVTVSLSYGFTEIAKFFFQTFHYIPPLDNLFYNSIFRKACANLDLELIYFISDVYNALVAPPAHILENAIYEAIESNEFTVECENLLLFLFEDCEIEVSDAFFEAADGRENLIAFLNSQRI